MKRLDSVGNVGMKKTTAKIGMTHIGMRKIVQGLKKVKGIEKAPNPTMDASPFGKLKKLLILTS